MYLKISGSKGGATKKVKEDIAKWKKKNVSSNNMLQAVIKLVHHINANIDRQLDAFEDRILDKMEKCKK